MEIEPATDNKFATIKLSREDKERIKQIGPDIFIEANINPADIPPLIFEEEPGEPASEAVANAS